MNFESLVSLLTDPQWSSNRTTPSSAQQSGTFEDFLLSDNTADIRDGVSRDAARQYIDEALTALGQSLRNGHVATQPIWQLFDASDSESREERATGDHSIDAPESAAHRAPQSGRPTAILVLLDAQDVSSSQSAAEGAVTGAFLGLSAGYVGNEPAGYARIPVVQSTSNDLSQAFEGILAGAASGGAEDAAYDGSALSLPEVLDTLGYGPAAHNGALLELTEQMRRARLGHDGIESLFYVPIRGFATGHLDQRSRVGSRSFVQVPVTRFKNDVGSTAIKETLGGRSPSTAPPNQGNSRGASHAGHSAAMSTSQTRANAQAARAPVSRPELAETLQGVLPARQNFFVFETGSQKKLYVRDYFTPAETLRRLNDMARDSLFDMAHLHVFINGKNYGRLC